MPLVSLIAEAIVILFNSFANWVPFGVEVDAGEDRALLIKMIDAVIKRLRDDPVLASYFVHSSSSSLLHEVELSSLCYFA